MKLDVLLSSTPGLWETLGTALSSSTSAPWRATGLWLFLSDCKFISDGSTSHANKSNAARVQVGGRDKQASGVWAT
jgi:hypothetical protein